MHYLILIAGILSLFIGFLAFKNNENKKETKLFSLFCFLTSIWIILNFFFLYFRDSRLLGFIYASGTFLIASLLSWTYVYVKKGDSRWKHVVIYSFASVISALSLFTNFIVGEVMYIDSSGIKIKEGELFPLFGIFLAGCIILSLIKIFISYKSSFGKARREIRMVFFGIAGFTGISMLVSSILPMFGIFSFTNLDSPSALVFVIFTSLAIIKHRFLNIKIVLSHLFVSMIVVLSAVEIFFSSTMEMVVIRTLFFFVFLFMGIMFLNSISIEIRRKEQLESANKKLRELDKLKSEFISMASHQLRTPLAGMKGFISIMRKGVYGEIPESFNEPIDHIESSNERLIHLVEDMLNVSQIEAGRMTFEFKRENLNHLAQEIFDSFVLMAEEKNLKLKIKKTKGLPKISIDYGKMREVISNIVDNAIKYTREGGVTIETRKSDNNKMLEIAVTDTGIGIEKGGFDVLFDKFSRGREAQEMKKSGVGLGLYLGRKIIEAHHGKIKVKSEGRDRGAAFIVQLPILKNNLTKK